MSSLDNKLKDLDLEFLHGVPVHLTDEMIAQIKQAFTEAGYTDTPKTVVMTDNARRAVNYQPLITGQEWYDRFEKELLEYPSWVQSVGDIDGPETMKQEDVLEAARKAANL